MAKDSKEVLVAVFISDSPSAIGEIVFTRTARMDA